MKRNPKKTPKGYSVALDPEVLDIYRKLHDETKIPLARLVNGVLLAVKNVAVPVMMGEWPVDPRSKERQ
jgi:hypothetical protein